MNEIATCARLAGPFAAYNECDNNKPASMAPYSNVCLKRGPPLANDCKTMSLTSCGLSY